MIEREDAAFHETGHAVADMRFGFGCGLITIIPNRREGTLGSEMSMDYGDSDDNMDEATNRVIVLLAGYAAQVEHNAIGEKEAALGASEDFEKAKDLLRRFGLSEDLRPWLEKTRQFVREEWRAIEKIAQDVLEVSTLDGMEAELILAIVDGDMESVAHLAQYRMLMGHGPTQQFKFTIQRTASSGSEASSGLDPL
jgi:hypothetical protein